MARLKLNLPRKYSRLPRVGQTKNPFKRGTSHTGRRVKRALAVHGAAFAANQIPGKAVAAGAIGAKLAGPAGAAAAFGATEAASVAASGLLARSLARRGRVAAYLARRSKRRTGFYKDRPMSMIADQLAAFDETVAKARLYMPTGMLANRRRLDALKLRVGSLRRRVKGLRRASGLGPRPPRVKKSLDAFDDVIEKARGLLSAGRKRNVWRRGGGTFNAQRSLGRSLSRTDRRIDRTYRGAGAGSLGASKRRGRLFARRGRLSSALSYLDRRAKRNARTKGLSYGDR